MKRILFVIAFFAGVACAQIALKRLTSFASRGNQGL
jgi:hypothetical protein